jgi:hypothetical protein
MMGFQTVPFHGLIIVREELQSRVRVEPSVARLEQEENLLE